jgi:hypothetical protein
VFIGIGRNVQLNYAVKLLQASSSNGEESRMELFKNWLAWVSNTEFKDRI